jgi:hypothetical protein
MSTISENRFDASFASRMVAAGVMNAIALLFIAFLVVPLFLLIFGVLFGAIFSAVFCTVTIGIIADSLGLIHFPLRRFISGESLDDTEAAALKMGAYVLPLSFSTAASWLITCAMSFPALSFAAYVIALAPATIAIFIINSHAVTPEKAVWRAVQLLGVVLFISMMIHGSHISQAEGL